MSTTLTIQNTYYDALFFASASMNDKKPFHLMPSELRLLQKLIHYSSTQVNITWSSENISKHIFTSITSIDKSIQRLKQKGYINVSTTQRFEKVKSRTIFINWEQIEMVNQLAIDYIDEIEASIQPEAAPEPLKEVHQPEAAPEEIEELIQPENEADETSLTYVKNTLIENKYFNDLDFLIAVQPRYNRKYKLDNKLIDKEYMMYKRKMITFDEMFINLEDMIETSIQLAS
jgi:predicted transcriptional regulator